VNQSQSHSHDPNASADASASAIGAVYGIGTSNFIAINYVSSARWAWVGPLTAGTLIKLRDDPVLHVRAYSTIPIDRSDLRRLLVPILRSKIGFKIIFDLKFINSSFHYSHRFQHVTVLRVAPHNAKNGPVGSR